MRLPNVTEGQLVKPSLLHSKFEQNQCPTNTVTCTSLSGSDNHLLHQLSAALRVQLKSVLGVLKTNEKPHFCTLIKMIRKKYFTSHSVTLY